MTTAPHLNLAPGIYYDVSEETYHADLLCERPTLSRSEAVVLVDQSPLHLQASHPRLLGATEKDVNKAMDFGSGAHAVGLGRGAEIVAVQADDWRTKDARAARDEARAQKMIPLLQKDLDRANSVVGALWLNLKRFDLFDAFNAAKSEAVLLWEESEHCWCRAMADKLLIDEEQKTARFFDLKFTESALPKWLPKHFADSNYHVQNAWYNRGLEQLRPDLAGRVSFTYVFQEVDFPYAAVPVEINGEFLKVGQSKGQRAVAEWSKCISSSEWPGYTERTVRLEPPPWLLAGEMAAQTINS